MRCRALLKGGPADGQKVAWDGGDCIRVAEAPKPLPVSCRPPSDPAAKISIATHDYRFEREIGGDWYLFRWVGPA